MMKQTVKQFYNESVDYEWKRLFKNAYHQLEFDTTMHFIKKYAPTKGLILDAGGGPGRYTITFAKLGYDVVLLDLSPKLLEKAKKQIKQSNVQDKVKDIVEGSITDLSQFEDETFDVTVCLGGPLSHVKGKKDRFRAISELKRVTKKNGLISIAVMGRLAVVIGAPRYWPEEIDQTEHFKKLWRDGDDNQFHKTSFAHFFLPEEFKECFNEHDIEILECIGLEGLGSSFKEEVNEMAKTNIKRWKNWLEAHYELCTHPSVFGTSSHMMIIGRKNS